MLVLKVGQIFDGVSDFSDALEVDGVTHEDAESSATGSEGRESSDDED